MKKLVVALLSASVLFFAACAHVDNEQRISVLYVGQNPDTHEGYTRGGDPEVNAKLNKTRAAEYMAFLSEHFEPTLVYGEDYKPEMSANYDVTIFDALPLELDGKCMDGSGYDTKPGERYKYASPHAGWRWLPDDFDHATIFVGNVLTNMGSSLKLTTSTLCNCLGKTAFDLDEQHPIFNSPNKVALNYQETNYARGVYNYYSGRNLPKSTQMLQMEVDDEEGMPLPPGLVTVPGTGDSPDTEFISGGTCIKSVNAVAIARHGNFLQWGFRSAPRHMTEPAKMAFINAVHYIKDFKGAKRIVKKRAAFRPAAMDTAFNLADQGWAIQKRSQERRNADTQRVFDKIAAGEASDSEKEYAKLVGKPKPIVRGARMFGIPKELQERFGDDWNAYLAHYQANYDYIYSKGGYEFAFDEDAMALGIANNDVAILERSIELLEAGEQVELAQRVLERYTEMEFNTAKEWRNWFAASRDKLFFTEVGGYKFLVNTL